LSAAQAGEAYIPEGNPLITLEPTMAAIIRVVLTGCVYDGSGRHAHRVTHVREAWVVLHLAMGRPSPPVTCRIALAPEAACRSPAPV